MTADQRPPMRLLIDENVPRSVAEFFASRGHSVQYVRDLLPPSTPDPVIAQIGDRLSAIVVTWDRDFRKVASRVPAGNRTKFRRLGRISFQCKEPRGVPLLELWIESIEFHYQQALKRRDFRMIVQIQESGFKVM
jgi:predicted nuclease of predicted toxin-antitoxin system